MVKTDVVVHLKIQTEEVPRRFGAKTDVVLLLFSISSKITKSVVIQFILQNNNFSSHAIKHSNCKFCSIKP